MSAVNLALLDLPEELIVRIMESLPTRDLLNVSKVCKYLAAGSDAVFQKWCNGHRWARPLVPRGRAALALFPFGAFFRQDACVACGRKGEFVLKRRATLPTMQLICRRCMSEYLWILGRVCHGHGCKASC